MGRSWSENSCIIDVHGNHSVCNYRVLDGQILLWYFENGCSPRAYAPQLEARGSPITASTEVPGLLRGLSSWEELLTVHQARQGSASNARQGSASKTQQREVVLVGENATVEVAFRAALVSAPDQGLRSAARELRHRQAKSQRLTALSIVC